MVRREASVRALARTASAASVLEPGLLRALRRALHPALDAGDEADLLLSGVVSASGGRFVRFVPAALTQLRRQLRAEIAEEQRTGPSGLLATIRTLVQSHHRSAPVTVQLHDALLLDWLATGEADSPAVRDRLASVVRASWDEDRPGVARWAAQLFRELPGEMQSTEPGQAVRVAARVADSEGAPPGPEAFRRLYPHLLASMPRVPLAVRRSSDGVTVRDGEAEAGWLELDVPGTEPRFLEIEGEGVVSVPAGGLARATVAPGPVVLRDGLGRRWELALDAEGEGVCWIAESSGATEVLRSVAEELGWRVGERDEADVALYVGQADDPEPNEDLAWAEERGLPVVAVLTAREEEQAQEQYAGLEGLGSRVGDPDWGSPASLVGRGVARVPRWTFDKNLHWHVAMRLREVGSPALLDMGLVEAEYDEWGGYLPRMRLEGELRDRLERGGQVGLWGERGSGKTSLVFRMRRLLEGLGDPAALIMAVRREDPPFDDARVEAHLRARLRVIHGEDIEDLRESIERAAGVAGGRSHQLVVFVDGWDGLPTWLPTDLPSGLTLLVASRDEPRIAGEVIDLDLHQWAEEAAEVAREVVRASAPREGSGRRLEQVWEQTIAPPIDDPAAWVVDAVTPGPSIGAVLRYAGFLRAFGPGGGEVVRPGAYWAVREMVQALGQFGGHETLARLWLLTEAREGLSRVQIELALAGFAEIQTVDADGGESPDRWPMLVAGFLEEVGGAEDRYRVAWPEVVRLMEGFQPVAAHRALLESVGRWPVLWGASEATREYALRHALTHAREGDHPEELRRLLYDVEFLAERARLGLVEDNRRWFDAERGPLTRALQLWDAETRGEDPDSLGSFVASSMRHASPESQEQVRYPDRPILQVVDEVAARGPLPEPVRGGWYFMGGDAWTWGERELRRVSLTGEVERFTLPARVTAWGEGILGLEDGSVIMPDKGVTPIDQARRGAVTAIARDGDRFAWGDVFGRVSRPGDAPARSVLLAHQREQDRFYDPRVYELRDALLEDGHKVELIEYGASLETDTLTVLIAATVDDPYLPDGFEDELTEGLRGHGLMLMRPIDDPQSVDPQVLSERTATCDAGVVFVTEGSAGSKWVRDEVRALVRRSGAGFMLVPVYVEGTGSARLEREFPELLETQRVTTLSGESGRALAHRLLAEVLPPRTPLASKTLLTRPEARSFRVRTAGADHVVVLCTPRTRGVFASARSPEAAVLQDLAKTRPQAVLAFDYGNKVPEELMVGDVLTVVGEQALREHLGGGWLPRHGPITAIALDGETCAWGAEDGTVAMASRDSGVLFVEEGRGPVLEVHIQSEWEVLHVHEGNGLTSSRYVPDGDMLRTQAAGPAATRLVDGHPSGAVVVAAGDELLRWSGPRQQLGARWTPHPAGLSATTVWRRDSEDWVVSGGVRGGIALWGDQATEGFRLPGPSTPVVVVQVTSDRRVLAFCEDGSIWRWDLEARRLLAVLGDEAVRWVDGARPRTPFVTPALRIAVRGGTVATRGDGPVFSFASDSSGATFTSNRNEAVLVWGQWSATWRGPSVRPTTAAAFGTSPTAVRSQASRPGPNRAVSEQFLARGDDQGLVSLHRLRAAVPGQDSASPVSRPPEEAESSFLVAPHDTVRSLSFLPGNAALVVGTDRGRLTMLSTGVWRVVSPEGVTSFEPAALSELSTFTPHAGSIRAIDVRFGLVATASDDGFALLWRTEAGRPIDADPRRRLEHPSPLSGVVLVSEVGRRDPDPESGAEPSSSDYEAVPDAHVLVTACLDGRVRAWNPATGALLGSFLCGAPATALGRFEDDRFAVGCADGRGWVLRWERMPDGRVRIRGDQLVVPGLTEATRSPTVARRELYRPAERAVEYLKEQPGVSRLNLVGSCDPLVATQLEAALTEALSRAQLRLPIRDRDLTIGDDGVRIYLEADAPAP